ncbi:MAG: type II toxin-antitoxin system RelE/ParE family toxin [Candidatus Saccharibacteria bacterium]
MASYKIVLDKRVRKKDIPAIPSKDRVPVIARIEQLSTDPYSVDSTQLKGRIERRVRQGNYRILYIVEEEIITVIVAKVGQRRDIYG